MRSNAVSTAQRVFTGLGGPADNAQLRHDQPAGLRLRPSRWPDLICERIFREMRCGPTSSAVIVHAPGLMPETRVVMETGPLAGTTPSMVSSLTKLSRG